MMVSITWSTSSGGARGTGLYAPMPPRLGPPSPSSMRLWAWAGASGTGSPPASRPHDVDDAGHQWSLRSDHGEVGAEVIGEVGDRRRLQVGHVDATGRLRDARIARRRDHLVHVG